MVAHKFDTTNNEKKCTNIVQMVQCQRNYEKLCVHESENMMSRSFLNHKHAVSSVLSGLKT